MNSEKKPRQIIDMMGIDRFSERLLYVMNGESNRSFAKLTGLSEAVIRNYLNGKTQPTLDKLKIIAKASGYTAEWLATGIDAQDNANINTQSSSVNVSDKLSELLTYLKRLKEDDLETILNQIVDNGVKSLIIHEQNQHAKAIADLILTLDDDDKREILSLIQAKKLGTIIERTDARKVG